MKKCFKCSQYKVLRMFYKQKGMKDGHLNKCKSCTKRDVKRRYQDPESRERIREYERKRSRDPERKKKVREYQRRRRQNFPGKAKANRAVSNAIRDGKLTKEPCVHCGKKKVEAHHRDYRKPLDITWVCFKCHREIEHGQKVHESDTTKA